jgi:hypothetical protein
MAINQAAMKLLLVTLFVAKVATMVGYAFGLMSVPVFLDGLVLPVMMILTSVHQSTLVNTLASMLQGPLYVSAIKDTYLLMVHVVKTLMSVHYSALVTKHAPTLKDFFHVVAKKGTHLKVQHNV